MLYYYQMRYSTPVKVWLSLGSNVGDRKQMLTHALETLSQHSDITIGAISSVYETAPWGDTDQSSFYNLVVEIGTALQPLELLNTAKSIERQLGREPGRHWGPRAIDIDIVLWEAIVLDTSALTIPHTHFRDRAFVLVPLNEIAPQQIDPITGLTVGQLLEKVDGQSDVTRVDTAIKLHNK